MTSLFKQSIIITPILSSLSASASAEMFRCVINGRPAYQSHPCAHAQAESVLTIKESTPEQKALAQEKLQAIRNQYESEKAQKRQNEQQELEKQLKTKITQAR